MPEYYLVGALILFTVFLDEFLKRFSPPRKKCSLCGRPFKS